MALVTCTVSINPAFLQEIKEDHHELRQLMHHAAAMLNRPGWMRVEYDRLFDLFEKLRDQLAMHFALEEAFGYFEDSIREAPRLSRRAEQLRSEHVPLFADLCELTERAEQLLYHETAAEALAMLACDFSRFLARFHEHELRECDLILEALNEELGVGD
jgi:hypothetical protein